MNLKKLLRSLYRTVLLLGISVVLQTAFQLDAGHLTIHGKNACVPSPVWIPHARLSPEGTVEYSPPDKPHQSMFCSPSQPGQIVQVNPSQAPNLRNRSLCEATAVPGREVELFILQLRAGINCFDPNSTPESNQPVGPKMAPALPVVPTTEPAAYVQNRTVGTALVAVDMVKVRSGPSLGASVIDHLKYGAQVRILGRSADWLKIELGDQREGWVASGWVVSAY
jgi:hypothetical protein